MIRKTYYSIKNKIVILVVAITTVVMLLTAFAFFLYDKAQFKQKTVQSITILAEVVGKNNRLNLIFRGYPEAREFINSLSTDPYIEHAVLYGADQILFAEYKKNPKREYKLPSVPQKDSTYFEGDNLIIFKYIVYNNTEKLGIIYVDYSMKEYDTRFNNFLLFISISILFVLIVAYILIAKFQSIITNPIFRLKSVIGKITETNNISIRARKESNDEIGELCVWFNSMLQKLEEQQTELNIAKQNAENALNIKEQILTNMSHEIRTPMNAILGMTNLLIESQLDKTQQAYADNTKFAAMNLMVVINDILDFQKVDKGQIILEKKEIVMLDFIDQIKNTIEYARKQKNISINFQIERGVPEHIIGDPIRLGQVLLNLLGNSVKFTSKGSITLKVSNDTTKETDDSYTLIFSVIDTGIGIPADKLNSIFESFTQVNTDYKIKYAGSGLGLAISQKLVKLLGGNMSVTSQVDVGSNFSFTSVFKKTLSPAKQNNVGKTVKDSVKEVVTLKCSVLLAEDNKVNQLFAKTILQKNGYSVDIADNGKIALDKLKSGKYDIVLMDIHMPEMDGYEATKYIRNQMEEPLKSIPIIALTAAATQAEIDKCTEAGMTDFVSKPFKVDDLLPKIEELTNKK